MKLHCRDCKKALAGSEYLVVSLLGHTATKLGLTTPKDSLLKFLVCTDHGPYEIDAVTTERMRDISKPDLFFSLAEAGVGVETVSSLRNVELQDRELKRLAKYEDALYVTALGFKAFFPMAFTRMFEDSERWAKEFTRYCGALDAYLKAEEKWLLELKAIPRGRISRMRDSSQG